jgi:hypothetical protein
MAYFEGGLRDLGPVPPALISPLSAQVGQSVDWVARDPRFTTQYDDLQNIVLRFPDLYPEHHAPATYTAQWDRWADLVDPIIAHVSRLYGVGGYGTAKILLSRLASGGQIPRHIDENPASIAPSKLHVPLVTDPVVTFTIGSTTYHLAEGRAYEVNNRLPHSVENPAAVARVHLIFEIYPLGGDVIGTNSAELLSGR